MKVSPNPNVKNEVHTFDKRNAEKAVSKILNEILYC